MHSCPGGDWPAVAAADAAALPATGDVEGARLLRAARSNAACLSMLRMSPLPPLPLPAALAAVAVAVVGVVIDAAEEAECMDVTDSGDGSTGASGEVCMETGEGVAATCSAGLAGAAVAGSSTSAAAAAADAAAAASVGDVESVRIFLETRCGDSSSTAPPLALALLPRRSDFFDAPFMASTEGGVTLCSDAIDATEGRDAWRLCVATAVRIARWSAVAVAGPERGSMDCRSDRQSHERRNLRGSQGRRWR